MKLTVIFILDFLAAVLLPILLVLRLIAGAINRGLRKEPVSIWTGSPIICMVKTCKAERLLGFDSRSVVKHSYFINDEFDVNLSRWTGGDRFLLFVLTYAVFFMIIICATQVHTYTDGGILPSRRRRCFNPFELFCYRLVGIRLLVWTYGGDVRTRGKTLTLGEPNCCSECDQVGKACICDDREWRLNFKRVSKAALAVFSMGDMTEYTPGSRNDLFFWPIDLQMDGGTRYRPMFQAAGVNRPLRVVHATNHRQFKGTSHLEDAVAQLRAEGVAIELVLVENVPNEQALDIYRSADLVFDQCLIGFHGYFALEAMALGKPVMCFIRNPERYLLQADECPIINTQLLTLAEDLRHMVEIRDELEGIGRRSRDYVEKYFSLEAFASRLRHAYLDLGVTL
jgi:glycosyltransferase involved in cell wall biosynthesis